MAIFISPEPAPTDNDFPPLKKGGQGDLVVVGSL